MRHLILCAALSSLIGTAGAATVEELTANSWMPAKDSIPSCEMPATITFTKSGKIESEPGCNTLNGKYSVGADDALNFEQLGLTRMMCAKEYMEQEAAFLDLIHRTRFAKKQDKYLILFDADHKEIGKLEPEKSGSCS